MNAADITWQVPNVVVQAVVPAVGQASPTAVLPVGWSRIDQSGRCSDLRGFMLDIAGDMMANHLQGVTDPLVHQTVAAAAYIELVRLFSGATAERLEAQCFPDQDGPEWPAERIAAGLVAAATVQEG